MNQINTPVNETTFSGPVLSLEGYRDDCKDGLEEWFCEQAKAWTRDDDVSHIVDNEYLRLLIKYDSLEGKEQESMFRYTEQVMAEEKGRRISQRNIFTELLCMGDLETWKMIEKYTDQILRKKGVGRKAVKSLEKIGGYTPNAAF